MDVIIYKIGFWVALVIMAASMTGYALRDDNNSNSTPEDTIIIQEPNETHPPMPVTPIPPVVKETPAPETIEVVQPVTLPENREEAFAKAKEKQQLEEPNIQDETVQDEPIQDQEPEPQPINTQGVVDENGMVFVGQEFAGRQVTIQGI